MNSKPGADVCLNNKEHGRKPVSRLVIIILLFTAALGVRFYHINRPPLDFSAIRQYQNAHIIRGLYYETLDSISEARRKMAKLNMERMGFVLEPRIIENVSVIGYRIMRGEHLWIPRVLSSIFWIIGGFFLYLVAMKFYSPRVSLLVTFFYLFIPFSILSSRSIQPDPLMVMMMLFSIHRILEYDNNPSGLNFITAVVVSAVAVLIKPYCIFIIFGAFVSQAMYRERSWKALFHRKSLAFSFLIIVLPAVYYGYNLLLNVGFVGEHVQGSFLPHLLMVPFFWRGWLTMIGQVVGYIFFVLAFLGLIITHEGRPKALLAGLWIGYFLFGLSATFQIHTHAYYSMPFIPIVALSLGALVSAVMRRYTPLFSMPLKITVTLVFCATILGLGMGLSKLSLKNIFSDYKSELKTAGAFVGVPPEFRKFLSDDFEKQVRIGKRIGELVGHSTNTVFLTPHFGRVLAYYGDFAGLPWPTSQSLYGREVRGAGVPDIKKDFTLKHVVLLYQGKFIQYTPDYFIVTAFDEFNSQTELKDFLNANFPILAKSDDYLIFDLRKMSE